MINLEVLNSRVNQLRCPKCKTGAVQLENNSVPRMLSCLQCNASFPVLDGYVRMLASMDIGIPKQRIQEFWGDTCRQWYTDFNKKVTSEIIYEYLDDLEKMYKYHGWMAVKEMKLDKLNGVSILEIGSGGGAESSLFKKYGANMTSIDITPERAASTALRLNLIKEGSALVLQTDAENLPFRDNSFDVVYSNGVLHHSENTEQCVAEVRRVLKPGGKAVILLYSRHSAYYWFNLLPRTIISGLIFKLPEAERLGILTEGVPKYGAARNPITRVYSQDGIYALFKGFKIRSLRKGSFSFFQLPIPGRFAPNVKRLLQVKSWKSGMLAFGAPYYSETYLEIVLGRYLGFAWNIVAYKEIEK